MKVIDLLNKIANGEEVPNFIVDEVEYYMGANGYLRDCMGDDAVWFIDKSWLNTEVEILEEPKGIPKKLGLCAYTEGEIAYSWSKSEALLKTKINEIIDYLESKGE